MARAYTINTIPGGIPQFINVSQYDKGYTIDVTLQEGNNPYSIPSGALVRVQGTKSDHYGFDYPCTVSNNVIKMPVEEQMTVFAGPVSIELVISVNGSRIGSANAVLNVEEAALQDTTIISDSDMPLIREAIAAAEVATEAAEEAKQAAQQASNKVDMTDGMAYNPSLKFGIGNNADATQYPRVELRKTSSGSMQGFSVVYYDANGNATFHDLVSSDGTYALDTVSSDISGILDGTKNHTKVGLGTANGSQASIYANLSTGNIYFITSPTATSQCQWAFGPDGTYAYRTRTRSDASSTWGSWSSWVYPINAKVNKAGDTMTGQLTFSGAKSIINRDTDASINTSPSANRYGSGYYLADSEGAAFGALRPYHLTNGNRGIFIESNAGATNTLRLGATGTTPTIYMSHPATWRAALLNKTVNLPGSIVVAGHITSGTKTVTFFIPYAFAAGGTISINNLRMNIRFSGFQSSNSEAKWGYLYIHSTDSAGKDVYTPAQSSCWFMQNGAFTRPNEISSITAISYAEYGYYININFVNYLCADSSGNTIGNNIPIAVHLLQLTGTIS